MSAREYFYEAQQFRQWWFWSIIGITTVGVLLFNVTAFYNQIILGIPYGDKPMSDTGLILFSILSLALTVGLAIAFYNAKLEIRVERYGISYRYLPFIREWRFIAKENIMSWKVGSYFPPGYGITLGFRFTTYNVSGIAGLELKIANRRNIRLGTRKPEELRRALQQMTNSEEQ